MGQKGPFCSHNERSLNHLDIEGHKKVYFVFYLSQLIPDDAWLYQCCSRIPDLRNYTCRSRWFYIHAHNGSTKWTQGVKNKHHMKLGGAGGGSDRRNWRWGHEAELIKIHYKHIKICLKPLFKSLFSKTKKQNKKSLFLKDRGSLHIWGYTLENQVTLIPNV